MVSYGFAASASVPRPEGKLHYVPGMLRAGDPQTAGLCENGSFLTQQQAGSVKSGRDLISSSSVGSTQASAHGSSTPVSISSPLNPTLSPPISVSSWQDICQGISGLPCLNMISPLRIIFVDPLSKHDPTLRFWADIEIVIPPREHKHANVPSLRWDSGAQQRTLCPREQVSRKKSARTHKNPHRGACTLYVPTRSVCRYTWT